MLRAYKNIFSIITKKVEYNPQKLISDTGFNLQLKVA